MPDLGKHYINNKWIIGSGTSFKSENPATGNTLWTGNSANQNEVIQAVQAAKAAFSNWGALKTEMRARFLQEYKRELQSNLSLLVERISKETGKPLWDSTNEVLAMIGKIDLSISAYSERCSEKFQDLGSGQLITRHRPHGVVAIFGPYNFPGHLPNGHIIPALLAGNTIIFKPSEFTPWVAETMMELWEKCGLPSGVLNMVQGGKETGQFLLNQTELNGIYFTGSWSTGKMLLEKFASQPDKILALELGGNNPLVFDDVVNLEAAAYVTILSAYQTSGQRCTCARRLILPKNSNADAFLNLLIQMISKIQVGPSTDSPEPFMGCLINEKAAQLVLQKQQELIDNGGKPLILSTLLNESKTFLSPGLIDVTNVSNRKDEEIFGPLLQIIRVSDFEDSVKEANQTQFGLTAGLLSDHEEKYRQFFTQIHAGLINWNTPTTGASSAAPFGGIGKSGNYRPSGYYAADYCSYPVASIESSILKFPSQPLRGIRLKDG